MESIFDILLIPMGFILRIAYNLTNNYLIAILLFTIVMELLQSPLGIKQQKNQVKQASLAPKQAAIRKKYAGRTDQATQQKMQQEIMEMYQRENFNPAGGCGTLLLQFPIIIALFNVVTQPLRYICQIPTAQIRALIDHLKEMKLIETTGYEQLHAINFLNGTDKSLYYSFAPDLAHVELPHFTIGGIDLSLVPGFDPPSLLLLIPVFTFIVLIASQSIMRKFSYQSPETAEAQNSLSMKIMNWSMPLISVYFEFRMPAVIGVYWIFRNLFATGERIVLAKLFPVPKFTEEDFKEAERQANLSNKQRKREQKQVRSLHHIDDEDYIARHPEAYGLKGPEDEPAAVGPTTEAKDGTKDEEKNSAASPAPIKNDDKTRYKPKSAGSADRPTDRPSE